MAIPVNLSLFALVLLVGVSSMTDVHAAGLVEMEGRLSGYLSGGLSSAVKTIFLLVGFGLAGSGLWQMIEARKNNNTVGGSLFMFFGGCLLIAYGAWALIVSNTLGVTPTGFSSELLR